MERLRNLRKHRSLTQKEIAAFLGVDRTTYVKYERGDSEPGYETIVKLADFFGVSTDFLLGRSDYPSSVNLDTYPFSILNEKNVIYFFGSSGQKERIALSPEQMKRAHDMMKLLLPEKFENQEEKDQ